MRFLTAARLLDTMPRLGDPLGEWLWIAIAALVAAGILVAVLVAVGVKRRK